MVNKKKKIKKTALGRVGAPKNERIEDGVSEPLKPEDETGTPTTDERKVTNEYTNEYYEKFTKEAFPSIEKFREEYKKDINELDKKSRQETREELNNIRRFSEQNQIRLIEVLALFVALFTFISINIQIFKFGLPLWIVAGFILILLGALCFFIVIVDAVLRNLPFQKNLVHKGLLSNTFQPMVGYTEKLELRFLRCQTWGIGFKIFLILLILTTILIGLGVSLVISGQKFIPKSSDSNVIELKLPDQMKLNIDVNQK
ncbi:MAG: hypothetical protein NT135_01915 [Candidatus Berkelbacteria bacterium]|nr:hypothetical protein [Candidatus Berkelbacteria bacterium]